MPTPSQPAVARRVRYRSPSPCERVPKPRVVHHGPVVLQPDEGLYGGEERPVVQAHPQRLADRVHHEDEQDQGAGQEEQVQARP